MTDFDGYRNDIENRSVLRLSDAFEKPSDSASLEVVATVLNINYNHNKKLLKSCKPLHDYSYFLERIREYTSEGISLTEAIDRAGEECIQKGILRELLLRHMGEVKMKILTEYDPKRHLEIEREYALEEGIEIGRHEGIEIGERRGIEIGRHEDKLETAEKLLLRGHMTAEEISEDTGLTLEEVHELKKTIDSEP